MWLALVTLSWLDIQYSSEETWLWARLSFSFRTGTSSQLHAPSFFWPYTERSLYWAFRSTPYWKDNPRFSRTVPKVTPCWDYFSLRRFSWVDRILQTAVTRYFIPARFAIGYQKGNIEEREYYICKFSRRSQLYAYDITQYLNAFKTSLLIDRSKQNAGQCRAMQGSSRITF